VDSSRLLLALTCGRPTQKDLAAADWVEIGRLAGQHRLQPWLAERWSDSGLIPTLVLEDWRDRRRHAAMTALAQRADLLGAAGALAEIGIASVALKGAWFAWYAYPAPALRPMNDIDLLVAPEQAMAAFERLRAVGYEQTRKFEHGPEHALAHDKHLPQLTSPSGTVIELHMRCWTGDVPRPRDAAILARARRMGLADPVLYPSARDLFAHLVIHATGAGRLDCGPLALIDLDRLLQREALDWPATFAEAEEEGWLRSAALLLALADRWLRPGLLEATGCPVRVPAEVADTAENLMVQDLTTCREAQFLAGLSGGAVLRGAARKLLGRAPAGPGGAGARRDFGAEGGYAGWLANRVRRNVTAAFGRRVREQASGYRTISAWCGGADAAA